MYCIAKLFPENDVISIKTDLIGKIMNPKLTK